ncbi:helix-turn-helix domain-containing protein [Streptomyces sp. ME19-01-6]|uniref:helix-turn-helix domain-containing protein n=1 Tax=Streptomyces sp. ME19-01-6 TaxID=3028686 RepID=UPI0029B5486A|nr:helix-turn-helix domain-containing protein [Streptomyces sp. ME19-01-6]MDX3230409.1 helix-turn-helix domain-containing protein [Streptomyces sp. ME19-01-6]
MREGVVLDGHVAFGNALRALRIDKGMSLSELARAVNYSKSHLSRIETGGKRPTQALALRCDEVLTAGGRLIALAAGAKHRGKGKPVALAQLPRAITGFEGRVEVLAELDAALAGVDRQLDGQAVVTVIDGAAGAGKTAAVVNWAHQVVKYFPDGTMFADLHGFGPVGEPTEPRRVLRGFLKALGHCGKTLSNDVDHLAAAYRSALVGKRMLIVLDNAVNAEQVRPLLPAESGCMVVVTSRSRLSGLVTRDGAVRVTMPAMTMVEGVNLLSRLTRTALDLDNETAERVVAACDRLPLSVRIAAERGWRGDLLPTARCDAHTLLSRLSTVDDETSTMSAVLSWSYRRLAPEAGHAFRVLGVHSCGDIAAPDAAMLLETSTTRARQLLDALSDIHLLEALPGDRYRFGGIMRAFAVECARRAEVRGGRT